MEEKYEGSRRWDTHTHTQLLLLLPIRHLPVTIRSNKVETSVDTHIDDTLTTGLLFLTHIVFMLIVDEFNDR